MSLLNLPKTAHTHSGIKILSKWIDNRVVLMLLIIYLLLNAFQLTAQSTTKKEACNFFPNKEAIAELKTTTSMMMNYPNSKNTKDQLFLLNPGFTDSRLEPQGQLYYCPFNAMLEGVLKYYPTLRDEMNITYVDFPRPRPAVVAVVGEENQGLPLLVINNHVERYTDLDVKSYQGTYFIQGAEEIAKYFGLVHDMAIPHP